MKSVRPPPLFTKLFHKKSFFFTNDGFPKYRFTRFFALRIFKIFFFSRYIYSKVICLKERQNYRPGWVCRGDHHREQFQSAQRWEQDLQSDRFSIFPHCSWQATDVLGSLPSSFIFLLVFSSTNITCQTLSNIKEVRKGGVYKTVTD